MSLVIESIVKRYGAKTILNQFSLTIEAGEKVAVIGQSGCGKSTLLRMILGLQSIDSGRISYNGLDISQMSKSDLYQLRFKIGILFQSGALFDSMSVEENVAFSLIENMNKSEYEAKKRVHEVLELVGMRGFEQSMPSDLSGGQRKRIGLARALAPEPEFMLYDEPTTGLDPLLSTSIEDLIVKLSDELKVTTLVVSHQRSTILRTADKIYLMEAGKISESVTPEAVELLNNDSHIRNFIYGGLDQ